MAHFHYVAKQSPQVTDEGVLEAESSDAAARALVQRGLFPVRVTEMRNGQVQPVGFWHLLFPVRPRRRLRLHDHALFARQLGDLLGGGLTLYAALTVLLDQTRSGPVRDIVAEIRRTVKEGQSLSAALLSCAGSFPPALVGAVRAGEASGALEETLLNTAALLEQEDDLRRRVREALTYPTFVLIVALLTVVALFTFVIPRLTLLYRGLGQALPLPTRLLLALSDLVRSWGLPLLLLLGGGIFFLARRVRRSRPLRKRVEATVLKLPLVGRLLLYRELVHFARGLATLTTGGVPAVEALRLASQATGGAQFSDAVLGVARRIQEGERLGQALQSSELFPRPFVSMVQVGEEGGHLSQSLEKVARLYERDLESSLKQCLTLLEPALILALGIMVAFVVLAMMLPILQVDLGIK